MKAARGMTNPTRARISRCHNVHTGNFTVTRKFIDEFHDISKSLYPYSPKVSSVGSPFPRLCLTAPLGTHVSGQCIATPAPSPPFPSTPLDTTLMETKWALKSPLCVFFRIF
jgi:hypothetical protein